MRSESRLSNDGGWPGGTPTHGACFCYPPSERTEHGAAIYGGWRATASCVVLSWDASLSKLYILRNSSDRFNSLISLNYCNVSVMSASSDVNAEVFPYSSLIKTITFASQSTASSLAFFMRPYLLLMNVTYLDLLSLIFLI